MSLICASKSCQSGTLILSLFLSPGPGDDIMIYAAPSTNIHTLIAINIQFWFPIQDAPITSSIHRDLQISTLSIPNLPLVRAMPTDRDSGRVNGSFHSVDAFGISSCEKGWMISLAGAGPVDMNTLLYTRHDDKTRFYSQVSSEAFQMMFTDDGHRTYGSNYNTPGKESALMYSSLFKEVKVSEEAFHKTLNDLDLPMAPPILYFIPNRKYVLDRELGRWRWSQMPHGGQSLRKCPFGRCNMTFKNERNTSYWRSTSLQEYRTVNAFTLITLFIPDGLDRRIALPKIKCLD